MLALDLVERVAHRARKFSLAVTMVPSMLNSITAWARLIAAILPASSMLLIFYAVMSVANLMKLTTLPFSSSSGA